MLDPEKLLAQLDSPSGLSQGGSSAATVSARYCSFCWCTLPIDAGECPDCGRTLEEMDEERKAVAAMDASWIPPHRSTSKTSKPVSVPATLVTSTPEPKPPVSSMPEPVAQELRKTRNHFLLAVVVGSAWGGAVMVAAYVTIVHPGVLKGGGQPAPPPGRNPVAVAPGVTPVESNSTESSTTEPGGTNVPGAKPEIQVQTLVPVHWPKLDAFGEGMIVELRKAGDSKAAPCSSAKGTASAETGDYLVTYTTRAHKWKHALNQPLTAKAGSDLVVPAPSADVAAEYNLWLGKVVYYPNYLPKAEAALRKAIEFSPKLSQAHLQLSGILVQEGRLKDAADEVQQVLDHDPTNEDALKFKAVLDKAAADVRKAASGQKPEAKQ